MTRISVVVSLIFLVSCGAYKPPVTEVIMSRPISTESVSKPSPDKKVKAQVKVVKKTIKRLKRTLSKKESYLRKEHLSKGKIKTRIEE